MYIDHNAPVILVNEFSRLRDLNFNPGNITNHLVFLLRCAGLDCVLAFSLGRLYLHGTIVPIRFLTNFTAPLRFLLRWVLNCLIVD